MPVPGDVAYGIDLLTHALTSFPHLRGSRILLHPHAVEEHVHVPWAEVVWRLEEKSAPLITELLLQETLDRARWTWQVVGVPIGALEPELTVAVRFF
jgi:hypothetical protein